MGADVKHTQEFKDKVMVLYKRGLTYTAIAEKLGIRKNQVSGIVFKERQKR